MFKRLAEPDPQQFDLAARRELKILRAKVMVI